MRTVVADKRWAEKYPDVGTGPVSAEPLVSAEHFALEKDKVFRRAWLNVGRLDDVPNPGDYVAKDLTACNASVLVVRGKDGRVRGFHNVCSHRGNKLIWNAKGHCKGAITCGFHAWSYNTKGALTWVSDEENFFDLPKCDLGLTPIHTDVFEGFIFINLAEQPNETLREYLGGVADQLDGGGFADLRLMGQYRVEERANWKIALDARNELYHLPFQHRRTIPQFCVMKDDKYARLLDVRLYNHHSVYASEPPDGRIGPATERLAARLSAADTEFRLPRIGAFDFYTIFPNFALLLFQGVSHDYFMTYNFWPRAVDRTDWDVKLYCRPAENAGQRIGQEYFKCLLRDVLQEDATAHEQIHIGLASRAKKDLYFQDDEMQIRYFHTVLERFYAEA